RCMEVIESPEPITSQGRNEETQRGVAASPGSNARTAGDFEVRGGGSIRYRCGSHSLVDGYQFASCRSCIVVPLRRHLQYLVRWNKAGLARDSTLHFGLRLRLASAPFIGRGYLALTATT